MENKHYVRPVDHDLLIVCAVIVFVGIWVNIGIPQISFVDFLLNPFWLQLIF